MKKLLYGGVVVIVVLLLVGMYRHRVAPGGTTGEPVTIGLVAELTGDIPAVGASSRNGAQLAVDQVNAEGGVLVNGVKHMVQLDIQDNKGSTTTSATAVQQIAAGGAVAIVGPNASRYAIPAGQAAESDKIVLLSPWSTDVKTTLDATGQPKKYVFRAAFTDPFQGRVLATFASDTLKAKTAAVLYDAKTDVLKGQAEFFTKTFESHGGKVVSSQTFVTGAKNFNTQLRAMKAANPDVVFLPSYYNDAALQVKAAKALGITAPLLGSDAWANQDLFKLCGSACDGAYVSAHYAADSSDPLTQAFVEQYKQVYNTTPDDVAALTYDSFGLLFTAMQKAGSTDREAIRSALASTDQYAGVTGDMQFAGSGDPVKSAVILQIKNQAFAWHATANP